MGNQPTTLADPSIPSQGGPSQNKPLEGIVKKLSLSRLQGKGKSKKKKGHYYPVPPDAEKPSPPSRPEVFQDQDQYFILRWDPPAYDGGCPLMGYIIQHLELGLPQLDNQDQDDTEAWYSSDPGQITQTECILNNLVPGTTYQFRIVAENLIGYSLPSDISEPIVFNPHGDLYDWFFPPTFISTLDDNYTIMEHEMLTLNVEVKGQPYPAVKWYDKNDQELVKLNNKRYKTKSSGFTRSLVITSVELSDAGFIKCVCSNQEGQIECFSSINVEAPPRIKRVHNPEFLQNPYDVNEKEEERLTTYSEDDYEDLIFQAGELARLKFLFSGAPRPDLLIYHNGEIARDSRIIKEVTDKIITIRIEGVMRQDRGEWLVKVENVLGEDCTSVLITVTDHPSPPGKPEILQLSDNTCILRWDEPEDDGGCPVHNYVVEYFRAEWGVWLKALTSKNPGAKIKDLIPGSKYMFRVKGENLYGGSDPSEESAEILITDSPSRNNEGLMPSLEESVEEEPMEILSHSDFQSLEEQYAVPARKNRPTPSPKPPRSPRPNRSAAPAATEDGKPVYNRGDLIRSAVTSSVDYVQRFLSETKKDSVETDDEYEYDFAKLQREYEEEMRVLRDKLEGSSDEEIDDDEDDGEIVEIPKKVEEEEEITKEGIKAEPEEEEEEFEWPRRRFVQREPKTSQSPVLHDRFKDYLTMKISSRNRSVGSSMRSLNSSDAKNESNENLRRLLDFDGDISPEVPKPEEEENPDEAVKIQEVRRAIILNEERLERERLERERRKEELRKEAEAKEAELEARRKAIRKQKSEQEVVIEEDNIDPEKLSKVALLSILVLMIPIYMYYGVYVMLLAFVVLLLLWNKCKRCLMS